MTPPTVLAAALLVGLVWRPGLTIALVALVVVLWVWRRPTVRHGSGNALRAENVVHEAGHYVIARRHGVWGVSSRVLDNGRGWTELGSTNLRSDAIITAAGSEAANLLYHRRDAGVTRGDAQLLRDTCRRLGITTDQAREMARAEVAENRGAIERAAARLDERGRL